MRSAAAPAQGIEPEARDVVDRPYVPGEPRQADFRRRENLDLVPERTELSRDLTGSEPGPFGEQNAHGEVYVSIVLEIHAAIN